MVSKGRLFAWPRDLGDKHLQIQPVQGQPGYWPGSCVEVARDLSIASDTPEVLLRLQRNSGEVSAILASTYEDAQGGWVQSIPGCVESLQRVICRCAIGT